MEQQPHSEQGNDLSASEKAAEREEFIRAGLERAWRTGRRIDDLTAKRIARELDPGSGPLHEFVETGAIPEDIEAELEAAQEVAQDLELDAHLPWIPVLGAYYAGRLIKSDIPYWNDPSMD
jgi:hypothetical protein